MEDKIISGIGTLEEIVNVQSTNTTGVTLTDELKPQQQLGMNESPQLMPVHTTPQTVSASFQTLSNDSTKDQCIDSGQPFQNCDIDSDVAPITKEPPMVESAQCIHVAESSAGERDPCIAAMESPFVEDSSMDTFDNDNTRNSSPAIDGTTPQKKTRITNSQLVLQCLPQDLCADALFEYRWPVNDEEAEYYMLQEQVSVFLEVKSFRRKYPDLERRQIDIEERRYLKDVGVVTDMQCDLGLTALKSDEIAELMSKDYPEKYKEYIQVLQKREAQRLAQRQQELQEQRSAVIEPSGPVSKSDIKRLTAKAIKAAANYNSFLMKERREERRYYYDMQTGIVQYPHSKKQIASEHHARPSPYPVAVLKGQYSDYYHRYTPDELKYLPLNSVMYNPPIRIDNPYMPLPPDPEEPVNEISDVLPKVTEPVLNRKVQVTKLVDSNCTVCNRKINKFGQAEKCIKCNQCQKESHPSCNELSTEMLSVILTYQWMCMECKVCVRCSDPGNEDKMIVCDICDRGYHTFCVGLKSIPEEVTWECPECVTQQ